jgi:hypothetical protein
MCDVQIIDITLYSRAGKRWGNVAVGVKKTLQGRGKGEFPAME